MLARKSGNTKRVCGKLVNTECNNTAELRRKDLFLKDPQAFLQNQSRGGKFDVNSGKQIFVLESQASVTRRLRTIHRETCRCGYLGAEDTLGVGGLFRTLDSSSTLSRIKYSNQ